jgi:hypothetical protein
MANGICKYEGDKVLLVEGPDDCHVVLALRDAHRLAVQFGIYECGGDDLLLKRLNALVVRPDPPSVIGVVLDADTSAVGRWASILAKLSHHNYQFPRDPAANGTIVAGTGSLPRLGIWLMPNNQIQGMLEDFCIEMIDQAGRTAAEDAVAEARRVGVATFIANHLSKAIVHTYLAWQDTPGRPLGQSITAQSLRPQTATAQEFSGWLARLFS